MSLSTDPITGKPWALCGTTVITRAEPFYLGNGRTTYAFCGLCLQPVITAGDGGWRYVDRIPDPNDDATAMPLHLAVPSHQRGNECYTTARAWDHGYTDGRFFNGRRRPGATRGRDLNYDLGMAAGILDRIELDGDER